MNKHKNVLSNLHSAFYIFGTFRKLRQKYGDIYSLYLGNDLTIMLNSYKVIYQAAVTNWDVFSGRPNVLANDATGRKKGVIMVEGLLWKNRRKFLLGRLQEFGFGKSSFETKQFERSRVLHQCFKGR